MNPLDRNRSLKKSKFQFRPKRTNPLLKRRRETRYRFLKLEFEKITKKQFSNLENREQGLPEWVEVASRFRYVCVVAELPAKELHSEEGEDDDEEEEK